METPPEALGEQAFIITDLETGKKYRLTETGDQIEISEGERVPVDEFLDLFGYLSLPKPGTPEPEEKPRTPRERSQTPESPPSGLGIRNFVQRTRRRISESPSPSTIRQNQRSITDMTIPVMTNKRSDRLLSDIRLVQELKVHKGVVWVMQFSPDNNYLATGGEDGNVYLWRVVENRNVSAKHQVRLPVFESEPKKIFVGHKSDILDISWAPGSEFILSAALDKSVRLWHIHHNECLREFVHTHYVTSIRFHPLDSGRFISGSSDGMLRLWNIAEYKVIASTSIASEKDIFTALCFSDNGETIVTGCFDGRCRIYNLNGNRLEKRAEIDVKNRTGKHRKGSKVTGIVRANIGSHTYLVSTHDSRIRMLQATTPPRHICKFKGHENNSRRPIIATPTSAGDFIVSGSDDGRVFLWSTATQPFKKQEREKVHEWEAFQAHHGFCACARFCPDKCRRPFQKLDIGSPSNNNYQALMRIVGLPTSDAGPLPSEFTLWGQAIITGGSRGEIRVWENFGVPMPH